MRLALDWSTDMNAVQPMQKEFNSRSKTRFENQWTPNSHWLERHNGDQRWEETSEVSAGSTIWLSGKSTRVVGKLIFAIFGAPTVVSVPGVQIVRSNVKKMNMLVRKGDKSRNFPPSQRGLTDWSPMQLFLARELTYVGLTFQSFSLCRKRASVQTSPAAAAAFSCPRCQKICASRNGLHSLQREYQSLISQTWSLHARNQPTDHVGKLPPKVFYSLWRIGKIKQIFARAIGIQKDNGV